MIPTYLYQVFMDYNFMILLFNLLPIWPLDGGKLLFLILSLDKPFPIAHRTTLIVSMVGTVVFFLVVIAMIPNNLNAWIIITFLLFSIYYEWKQSRYVFIRFLLERYYGHSNEIRKLVPIEVAEDDKLFQVLEHFHRGCKHSIIVHKSKTTKYSIDENEVLHAYFSDKLVSAKISDILYLY
jgi:stage IV sporulation protein FB